MIVCWDLDNTLVDSGALIRDGRPIAQAWIEAVPVPGMLAFAAALRARLAGSAHVVLSVRTGSVRAETLAWLERERFGLAADDLWLVSSPDDKPAVWRTLARNARLIVVDDLMHGHQTAAGPLPYDALVEAARRTADVYVGAEEIARMRADPAEAERHAGEVAERLAALRGVSAGS